jgi:hypothetical protein
MPRRLRQFRADLWRSGYLLLPKRGKGSHTYWTHPNVPGYSVTLSGMTAMMHNRSSKAQCARRKSGRGE